MNNPRNKQFVKATLNDGEVVPARFYEQMVSLGGEAGYEYRRGRRSSFCPASKVTKWQDDSANDPVGYDLSRPPDDH